MKTKLQLTCLTGRALLAVLICSAPLVWGIQLRAGRVEKVTILGDKVVRVRG